MAKIASLVISALLTLWLAGCATQGDNMVLTETGPHGDSWSRVSNLKRLVILPPKYEIDGTVDKGWSQETEDQRVQEAAIRYLEDWRDYRVKPASGLEAGNALHTEELRGRLLDLLSGSGQQTKLPKETRTAIQRLATAYEADGVVVLGLRYEGLNAKRWGAVYGIAFFTLSLGMWPYLFSLGTDYTAAIFDARDGEMVWYGRIHQESFDRPGGAGHVALVFGSLPNALPQGMLEPQ